MSNMITMLERPSIRVGGVPPPTLNQDGEFVPNPGQGWILTESNHNANANLGVPFHLHINMTISRTPDEFAGEKLYVELEARNSTRTKYFGIRLATGVLGVASSPFRSDLFTYRSDGQKINTTGSAYGASWGDTDVIGILWDCSSGDLTFFKNGISQGVAFTTATNIASRVYIVQASNANTARLNEITIAGIPDAGEVSWWEPALGINDIIREDDSGNLIREDGSGDRKLWG